MPISTSSDHLSIINFRRLSLSSPASDVPGSHQDHDHDGQQIVHGPHGSGRRASIQVIYIGAIKLKFWGNSTAPSKIALCNPKSCIFPYLKSISTSSDVNFVLHNNFHEILWIRINLKQKRKIFYFKLWKLNYEIDLIFQWLSVDVFLQWLILLLQDSLIQFSKNLKIGSKSSSHSLSELSRHLSRTTLQSILSRHFHDKKLKVLIMYAGCLTNLIFVFN